MTASCGSCTMCCRLLGVPELNKPACTRCVHVNPGVGCNAYDARPKTCRDFECVWLQSQTRADPLHADLRPDRCGVVLAATNDGQGLVVHVDPHKPQAHQRGLMRSLIHGMVKRRMQVVLVRGAERMVYGLAGNISHSTEKQP